jgi:hypothetical protein
MKAVLRDVSGGDPRRLVKTCSRDLFDHALAFRLTTIS